jgi:hypothetical protein
MGKPGQNAYGRGGRKFTLNRRSDGRVELICVCGVGHPSWKGTTFLSRSWRESDGVHGCCGCGCCATDKFKAAERRLFG